MSAKRELSSTLKNLKFMQREVAVQKIQDKTEVEVETAAEVVTATDGGFGSSAQVCRKCIVIMEGNPHPGAVRGQMSFQNFNPEIDKLNEEPRGDHQTESASPSSLIKTVQSLSEVMEYQHRDLGTLTLQKAYL